jgi:hypothetical protein
MSLDKDAVKKLLESIHPKEESDVEKYTKLLETVSNQNNNGIDPLMLMLLTDTKGKGMDKLYDIIAVKEITKLLRGSDDSNESIKNIIEKLDERTDKKIEALQKSFQDSLKAIVEVIPKPKSEEALLLEKIAEKLSNPDKKGDSTADEIIKLITVLNNSNKKADDPVESFSKIYGIVNSSNDKYMDLKEQMLKQANDATQKQLEQALRIIDQQKDNADWMNKLKESTQTINQFKKFMEESGLKPVPAPTEKGKVDLKYILDTVNEVVKNIIPAIPPPKSKPSWDVEKEAQRLYSKYKDAFTQPDGSPITIDIVRQELMKNPDIERVWDAQITEALKQQMKEEAPAEKESEESKNVVEEIFDKLQKEKKVEEKPATPEEKPDISPPEIPKPKTIKGNTA